MRLFRLMISLGMVLSLSLNACLQSSTKQPSVSNVPPSSFFVDSKEDTIRTITKSNDEWKAELDGASYYVLREEGTERAFTGKYADNHKQGIYYCKACHLALFSSKAKFESGTGWPSFYEPIDKTHVLEIRDNSMGMERVEVRCPRCGGHLGHVFDDGPKPTGLRYCMNSVALSFEEQ